jgi:hypothetical protein
MSNKRSLSYFKTETAEVDKNIQQERQQQLLHKDFRNAVYNNNNTKNNNGIEELKRKIDTITRYQKPR